jgi:flavodoxin
MGKTLVAYYTYSPDGVTKKTAEAISELTGGDMFAIEPVDSYPTDMQACIAKAKEEIDAGYQPPIKALCDDLASYDTVFVGSPNWCSTIAPPLATFIGKQDFSGKKVAPFLTFGGSGVGKCLEDVASLASGATVLDVIGVKASDVGEVKKLIEEALAGKDL